MSDNNPFEPMETNKAGQAVPLDKEQALKEEALHAADSAAQQAATNDDLSLSDDRRVKTLSPGALVVKRFMRNRVAVTGLVILAIMFIFSFIGGVISPYKQDQLFYRYENLKNY